MLRSCDDNDVISMTTELIQSADEGFVLKKVIILLGQTIFYCVLNNSHNRSLALLNVF